MPSSPSASPPSPQRRRPWVGPALFAVLAAASFWLFWGLRYYIEFSDETDVPVFGRLVAEGRVLHADLFSHHTHLEPLMAWVVAKAWPAADLAGYRGLVWLLQLGVGLSLAFSPLLSRRGPAWLAGGLYLLAVYLVGPLWFGQMIMAYNLWGAFCAMSVALWAAPWACGVAPGPRAAFAGGLATAFWIMGTPFTVYPAAALVLLMLSAGPAGPARRRSLGWAFGGLGAGLLLQLAWLLAHADLAGLWDQSIVFNAKVFAPFLNEPVGFGGRLRAVALDFWDYALHARSLERFFLGAMLGSAGAAWLALRAQGRPAWRAGLAALAVLLFFAGLRARGGHWRALPFVFGATAAYCAAFAWSLDRGRRKLALLLGLGLALVCLRGSRGVAPMLGVDSFHPVPADPVFDLARRLEAELPPQATVLAVPFRSSLYLLSRRAPGMDAAYYYPWIVERERQGGRMRHGDFCAQLAHYKPAYVLLNRHVKIWTLDWSAWQPACLDQALRQGYERVPFAGVEELWRLKPTGKGKA